MHQNTKQDTFHIYAHFTLFYSILFLFIKKYAKINTNINAPTTMKTVLSAGLSVEKSTDR